MVKRIILIIGHIQQSVYEWNKHVLIVVNRRLIWIVG